MKRVLLTGVSGTGKSSVVAELARRGYPAVDADQPGYSQLVPAPDGMLTGVGGGQDWVWHGDTVEALLAEEGTGTLFVSGSSPNQGRFYPRFDHVILLTAPAAVIAERLATRTTNDFGKDPDELARALEIQRTIEPLLRHGADAEIDTTAPLDEVVEAVLSIAAGLRRQA